MSAAIDRFLTELDACPDARRKFRPAKNVPEALNLASASEIEWIADRLGISACNCGGNSRTIEQCNYTKFCNLTEEQQRAKVKRALTRNGGLNLIAAKKLAKKAA